MKKKFTVLAALIIAILLCGCTDETTKMLTDAIPGDIITFGTYEQDNDAANGAEAISWRVIEKTEDKVFVISEYVLDSRRYHNNYDEIGWSESELRAWLNGEFLSSAFSEDELLRITETELENPGSDQYTVPDDVNTTDKIFLPNVPELRDGAIPEEYIKALPTEYAVAQNVEVRGEGYCMWWLRGSAMPGNITPEGLNRKGATIDDLAKYFDAGRHIILETVGVRPAMWLKIEIE